MTSSSNPLKRYATIFIVALAVRLTMAAVMIHVDDEWPVGSSIMYRVGLAESILEGSGFSYGGFPCLYQTPVYPAFLAVIFFCLGNAWWSVALVQSVIDAGTAAIIASIGGRFSKHGWWAGVLYAFYPFSVLQCRAIVDTTLLVFLFVSSIHQYLLFSSTHRVRHLVLAGLLAGVGILDRPSCVVVPIAFAGYLVIERMSWKQKIRYGLIAMTVVALVPSTWILRNYTIVHRFPVLAVGGQHFFWYAHNRHIEAVLRRRHSPDSIGRSPLYPMDPTFRVAQFFGTSPAEQVALGEECSRIAGEWISANPREVARYTWLKIYRFLSFEYVIQAVDNPLQRLRIQVHRMVNGPLTILGWIGVAALVFTRPRIGLFILAIVLGFIAIHVITMFGTRHKVPLDALFISLIPLSVATVKSGLQRLGSMMRNPAACRTPDQVREYESLQARYGPQEN